MIWYILYNVLLHLASPVIVLILAAKRRCRRGLLQRFGFQQTPFGEGGGDGPLIWIHAVSLGEVVAAAPLVRRLHERYPAYRLMVTTVTETGREAVEQRLAGVAVHRYAPLDFPWTIARVLDRWNPALYLFVETELWPNLLRALARRRIPAILVNGRLSTRSYERQRTGMVRPLYRAMLGSLSRCLMQSERDSARVIALGADPARVRCTGNMKFDQPLPATPTSSLSRASLALAEQERLFIAGSTHPGEEEQVLAAYQEICRVESDVVLMVAPRHIERAGQLEAVVRASGLPVLRRSLMATSSMEAMRGPRVIILDSRGELAGFYREATVTFVGGTLVPVGGHNLLEPAAWGKPVLFGPYTDHCAEVADLLGEAGGGIRVRDARDLAARVIEWLQDEPRRAATGEAARRVVQDNQGALAKTLDEIAPFLPSDGVSSSASAEAASLKLSSSGV